MTHAKTRISKEVSNRYSADVKFPSDREGIEVFGVKKIDMDAINKSIESRQSEIEYYEDCRDRQSRH